MTSLESATGETACSAPAPTAAHDRDVVEGFPVKKLTLMILFANMMFCGGWYVNCTLEPLVESLDRFGTTQEPFDRFESVIERLHDEISDLASDYPIILLIAPMLGTFAGLAWYVILRWRESKLIRERREALLATRNAGTV